jgi:ankyrin repeat domain-containing protein 50
LQHPGEIEKRLGKLLKDLKLAYDEIYNGMTEHEREIADRAFQWVMCAAKPLDTRELLPALCQDGTGDTLLPLDGLDEELALEYCHNLLVIDPIRKVWVPSHLSVIEYIEDHLWSQRQANSLVSSVCLLALQNTVLCNREEKWIMPKNMRSSIDFILSRVSERKFDPSDPLDHWEFNFLSYYARHHWTIHAKKSSERGSNYRIPTLVDEFLGLPTDSSPAYRCWMRMVIEEGQGYYSKIPWTSIFRHGLVDVGFEECIAGFVYCAFDLVAILPDWHDFDWVKQDQRTGNGQTFLELAAQVGAVHTCRELVKHGAEVNAQTKSDLGSPLAATIFKGQENVVEFLLKDGGADVNIQQHNIYGSALAIASYRGLEDMVRLLVKRREIEVNMQLQYGYYGSALAAASWSRELKVVEFLVKEGGAEVNMQLQYGRYGSALAAASYGGEQEVVRFLVEEGGAEVNMQLQHGRYANALEAAEEMNRFETAELLIKLGAERKVVEDEDNDESTADEERVLYDESNSDNE